MSLKKLFNKVAKFAADNPELAAVVLPVAGGVLSKAAPKVVPKIIKAIPVVKAAVKAAKA